MTAKTSTEALIARLEQSPAPAGFAPGQAGLAIGFAILAGLAVFMTIAGFRDDLGSALTQPLIVAKTALPLALCALGLPAALALARPEARRRLWPLALPVALALALVLWRLTDLTGAQVWSEALGQTAAACLASIIGLSLPPLAAGLWMLRKGAPADPARVGALLGLAVSGAIASGYALHCIEDSPLFFVGWYGLGMAFVTLAGGWVGGRVLRW